MSMSSSDSFNVDAEMHDLEKRLGVKLVGCVLANRTHIVL